MEKEIYLYGVALKNYRGIGDDPALIAPFSRFNFFIGPNNAGKSGILHFITNHLMPLVCKERQRFGNIETIELAPLDINLGATRHQVKLGIGYPSTLIKKELANSDIVKRNLISTPLNKIIDRISIDGFIWVTRGATNAGIESFFPLEQSEISNVITTREWQSIWSSLNNSSGGSLDEHWIPTTISKILASINLKLPKISMIPAIRQISPKGHEFKDWTGTGLIEQLARLQNPSVHERSEIEKFDRINWFLRHVTEREDAKIEIPHDRECVLVHMDGKVLPLESLGMGIHEVVMLASFCTLMKNQIICIEEPEIHLHPLLQRRLIHYLEEKTNNQYFIATHSASFIDVPNASVFHIKNNNGTTEIKAALNPSSKFNICRDLGYKASDIIQSNAIIWVEGPSDRIYIQHWIGSLSPDLREGIDYSIMFYGGRLLSHLHTEDIDPNENEISSLIAIRQLNRNLAFVIDSDKTKEDDTINKTKQRILEELRSNEGIGWLTKGREIENYIEKETMTKALSQFYSKKFESRCETGTFDHVLHFRKMDSQIFKDINKIEIAKIICSEPANLDILDLREQITKVVKMIKNANHTH